MSDLASIPLLQTIGWALLHSLWQGALLALLAAVALRLAQHRSAELRYAIASGTLGLLVLAFAGTLVWVSGGGDPLPMAEGVLLAPVGEGHGLAGWLPRLRMVLGPWLFLVWILGFSLRIVQMGRAMTWLYGPCLGSLQPPPAEWLARFETLRIRSRVRIPVRLGLSDRVDSPVVLGWLKPVVLVPAAAMLALSPEALEAVLAHELAHVRRGDFFANVIQNFAEALLFYHPAVWWLSRHIRQEREHCCDDAAVQACGDPILYASALAGLEELRTQPNLIPDLAPAASGGRLMLRIQRLLHPHPVSGMPSPMPAFVSAFLLLSAIGAAALSARNASEPPPTKQAAVNAAPANADPLGTAATVEIVPKVLDVPRFVDLSGTNSPSHALRAATLSASDASEPMPRKPEVVNAAPGNSDPLGGEVTAGIFTKAPEDVPSANKDVTESGFQTGEPREMESNRIRVVKQPAPPPYPPLAKKAHIKGNVVVLLTVDEAGKVASAKAISGPPELHTCAVDYARAWEFEPAKVNGKPVAARFKLTMPFRLR